jgi:CDP-diacylglycerol---glycerol-3-phosphate 3-phosphatidyltransferase
VNPGQDSDGDDPEPPRTEPDGAAGGAADEHGRGPSGSDSQPTVEELSEQDVLEVVELEELRRTPDGEWLNVPNALTFLRALLVPVIFVLLAVDTRTAQWWAFGIFVFAALTDTVDGWVARRWHGVTRWGQFADPIADKLLVIGTLVAIAWHGELPWWAVIVIAIREVVVTAVRVRLISSADVVMPASPWGKSKTVSQLVAVALYLVPGVPEDLRLYVLYLAVILTVVSGVDYGFRSGKILRGEGG